MDIRQLVGMNVRRLRLERGLSQEAAGLEMGLHRTWIGAVERSERNLTVESIERLAEGLEVEVADLLRPR